ncbi:hypothetical protein LCGC14_2232830 [marine sediment metagenome]|uniref:Uncharacterized protein n=1 Tax=marine sediment metagenome TaxID=412755 RepID=A0A0F9G2T4_9ZZZZ
MRIPKPFIGLALVLALAGAGIVLAAVFSPDHDELDQNVLTSDSAVTLNLIVEPATALLTAANMAPGDNVCGIVRLTTSQSFVIETAVSVEHLAPSAFADELILNIRENNTCALAVNPDGSPTLGTNLFHGPYTDVGTMMSTIVPAAGGERTLQFTVVLPNTIPDFATVASQSDTATIVFDTDVAP